MALEPPPSKDQSASTGAQDNGAAPSERNQARHFSSEITRHSCLLNQSRLAGFGQDKRAKLSARHIDKRTWEIVPVISRCAGAHGIMHVDNTFTLGGTNRIRQGALDPLSVFLFLSPAVARSLIQRPTGLGGTDCAPPAANWAYVLQSTASSSVLTLRKTLDDTFIIWTHRSGAQDEGRKQSLGTIHLTGLQDDSDQRDSATYIHRGFPRDILHFKSIAMQLTSILSAALLPLLALAQDTTSGTTTLTQTSTMTKTITLASNTVTMTATNNSTSESTSVTRASSKATATASSSSSSAKSSSSETPGVNGLGNGAASLGSSHVAIAGVAGMLVVALM
ncbi:hypothetical protein J7T55_011456 [Diaporthe amygdali]|uniref:uncharacterized protein n=1 Tax=Phomopsis amygdali TaxID=1214568 RepID=UPI0022FE8AF5|nr:uncharacterized protein J7T55_011456 [Diaporthe amygdali]KAJ0122995.1 hypothetical protein J7T55_011456 [Diaporthe amygdali]